MWFVEKNFAVMTRSSLDLFISYYINRWTCCAGEGLEDLAFMLPSEEIVEFTARRLFNEMLCAF